MWLCDSTGHLSSILQDARAPGTLSSRQEWELEKLKRHLQTADSSEYREQQQPGSPHTEPNSHRHPGRLNSSLPLQPANPGPSFPALSIHGHLSQTQTNLLSEVTLLRTAFPSSEPHHVSPGSTGFQLSHHLQTDMAKPLPERVEQRLHRPSGRSSSTPTLRNEFQSHC